MLRSLVVVFTFLAAISAVGCSPRGYRECMNEAAGKPTERGVAVAAGQCAKQFAEEYAEQRAQGGGYSPADKPAGKSFSYEEVTAAQGGGYSPADKPHQPNPFDQFDAKEAAPRIAAPVDRPVPGEAVTRSSWIDRAGAWWATLSRSEITLLIGAVWLCCWVVGHLFSDEFFWRQTPRREPSRSSGDARPSLIARIVLTVVYVPGAAVLLFLWQLARPATYQAVLAAVGPGYPKLTAAAFTLLTVLVYSLLVLLPVYLIWRRPRASAPPAQ